MPSFFLTLEYDGTAFEGWQSQPGEHRTVQDALHAALARVTGQPARVMGSGRTDSGVHAEGQVASVEVDTALAAGELGRALNGVLPRDVAVLECGLAREGFDARREALSKHYRYRIWNGPIRSPLRERRFAWEPRPLDVSPMQGGASQFVGLHDFACLQAAGSDVTHTVRELSRVDVSGDPGGEMRLDVEGSGFLRHMVRNLAGTLIEVGLGRRSASGMSDLLASGDRGLAGPTAPAQGLSLIRVDYPPEVRQSGPSGDSEPRHSPGKSNS